MNKYKLYEHCYEGGYSLGGVSYPGGTDFYITDMENNIMFCQRDVDEGAWWIRECDGNICDLTGKVRCTSLVDDSYIKKIKWNDADGKLIRENYKDSKYYPCHQEYKDILRNVETKNAFDLIKL